MSTGRQLLHALIGAIVAVLISFIPFSTVIGGAVAGYLEGPDVRAGAIVGVFSGLIMFLPIAATGVLVFVLGLGFGLAGAPLSGTVFLIALVVFVAFTILVYTVVLAAAGGYLGSYLAQRYPEKHASTLETIGVSTNDPTRAGGEPLEE